MLLNTLFQPAFSTEIGSLQPARLAVYVSPPTLPADGRGYTCVYVQIQDLEGMPFPAPSTVNVSLTSSNLEVGCVEGKVTIGEGETFAVALFNTTHTPGLTIITASASGFISGFAALTTVNPSGASSPFKLNVYAQSLMPSEAGLNGTLTVQAVGSNGLPLPLQRDVKVTLTSSNTTVLDVPLYVVIPAGASYTQASYTVKGASGRSTITAMADGFIPGSAEVVVKDFGGRPAKLLLTLTPPVLAPDGCLHEGVVQVQLLDEAGAPATAAEDIQMYISTSNPDVGEVFGSIKVQGRGHATSASVKAGFKAGDAVITLAAGGLEAASSTLHVVGLTPSKLAVYAAPTVIPADGKPKNVLAVQVQDANGVPVASNRDVYVQLTSSSPRIGQVPALLTVEKGESTCTFPFIPTLNPGVANITASAQGLESATMSVETWAPALNLTIEAPSAVRINQTVNVKAFVSYGTLPVEGASVEWAVSGAEVIAMENVTDADGSAAITLKQTSEKAVLTVKASKPGFSAVEAGKSVAAIVPIEQPPLISIFGFEVPIFTLALAIAILVAALIVAYTILKLKFRKGKLRRGEA
jgi:hypothetical protein